MHFNQIFQGPVFPEPLNVPADLKKLTVDGAVNRLNYVGDAITRMRHLLDGKVPLIGFTGAPVSFFFKFFFICLRIEKKKRFLIFLVDFNGLYD